ncbi:MAG: rimM [Caulobacter sp.]|nr:rimM [Caulobacter sp.]
MGGESMILVARVAGAFGVKGEVRITTFTEDPLAVAGYRELKSQDGGPALTVLSARVAKGGVVARAKDVDTKEAADAIRGLALYVARADLPQPDEDEFYLTDLVGLTVVTPTGETLGRVKTVQNFGAGDIIEVDPQAGGQTWYLPFTRDAVPSVDIAGGKIVATPPQEVE